MMRSTRITTDVTTVECHNQVRSWRLLRTIMELLIPTCNCTFVHETNHNKSSISPNYSPTSPSSTIFTGTIFGCKQGKVKFCVQQSNNSVLLLELAVPTSALAREMRGGLLRIALECTNGAESQPLLDTPVWRMYCNGRKVGYAVKRRPSKADIEVLRRMSGVVVGAGVVRGADIGCQEDDDDIMYLRGNFERVKGSSNAESFHFIDPDGNTNQDLSIFFLRST
ncbi:protein MIZU-KUSSEI 1-like [Silene latifolia]|uniref:protein MIZU-KUSSEI 1-like n=1 Tax=Silene latifolia TaxID=37657 RepID=UPI003D77F4D7